MRPSSKGDSTCLAVAVALLCAACSSRPLPFGGNDGTPASAFTPVVPCLTETDYVTGVTVVRFGFLGSPRGFVYDPACLEVGAGTIVTFTGDFSHHPLYRSRERGTVDGNPIAAPSTGQTADVTFPNPGYYAYYCGVHGALDDGQAMAGVVWVR